MILLSGCTAPTAYDCEIRFDTQRLSIDGSSTVYPIAELWAEDFGPCVGLRPAVKLSGTGGGFQKLCRGEIDVADASRPIKQVERTECERNGIEPFAIQIAIDGLAVVVPEANTFVDHLSVTELNRIWSDDPSRQARTWAQVRAGWPDTAIGRDTLCGPGTNSGTFDYFIESVIHPFEGTDTNGRSDYTASEEDHVIIRCVQGNAQNLGYLGLAFAEHARGLRMVPILQDTRDGGKSSLEGAVPVAPTTENIESGRYAPLARPLFMYTKGQPTDRLAQWLVLGLSPDGQDRVAEAGYVRLPEAVRVQQLELLLEHQRPAAQGPDAVAGATETSGGAP